MSPLQQRLWYLKSISQQQSTIRFSLLPCLFFLLHQHPITNLPCEILNFSELWPQNGELTAVISKRAGVFSPLNDGAFRKHVYYKSWSEFPGRIFWTPTTMTSESPLLQSSHNAQRKFSQLWELSRMITLAAEMVKSTGRNTQRAACVALKRVRAATLKKSTPLMSDRLRRRCCAAAPFQISIRAAAALLTFSSAHFSSASTGVAYFSLFTNTSNWAVSVPFALDPCLGKKKVRLLKAASALLEVFTAGDMLWLKPINLTSRGTWCDSLPGSLNRLRVTPVYAEVQTGSCTAVQFLLRPGHSLALPSTRRHPCDGWALPDFGCLVLKWMCVGGKQSSQCSHFWHRSFIH